MSTQRYISTSFWDDEWIQSLDPSEKLLYLYFMTNPLTNIAGVYKLTVRRICFDTGFNSDTVGHIMQKFEAKGKAYRIGEYIALPAWPNHQKWETKSCIKDGIDAVIAGLPGEVLTRLGEIKYAYPIPSRGVEPPRNPPGTPQQPTYSDSDSDSDSDLHSNIDISGKPDASASSKNRFIKPTIEEVKEYCESRGNGVDGNKWMAHYESVGWKVGKNPMKDWKAAVRTWEPVGFVPIKPKAKCRKCKDILATDGDFIGHCWNEKCELYHCEKQT